MAPRPALYDSSPTRDDGVLCAGLLFVTFYHCHSVHAMGLNPKGRNWGSLVNFDDLGKTYIGIILAWTVMLCAGVAWLVMNRRVPFIKMRNLPLAIASTAFLHVYLVKIVLAYTTNGHFLCSAEFWIMSIYLPFGIALFQANITQLRSISYRQKKLLSRQLSDSSLGSTGGRKKTKSWNLWTQWRDMNDVQRSYVFIGFFMLVQVGITLCVELRQLLTST